MLKKKLLSPPPDVVDGCPFTYIDNFVPFLQYFTEDPSEDDDDGQGTPYPVYLILDILGETYPVRVIVTAPEPPVEGPIVRIRFFWHDGKPVCFSDPGIGLDLAEKFISDYETGTHPEHFNNVTLDGGMEDPFLPEPIRQYRKGIENRNKARFDAGFPVIVPAVSRV